MKDYAICKSQVKIFREREFAKDNKNDLD